MPRDLGLPLQQLPRKPDPGFGPNPGYQISRDVELGPINGQRVRRLEWELGDS
jgi:hypothetical protein